MKIRHITGIFHRDGIWEALYFLNIGRIFSLVNGIFILLIIVAKLHGQEIVVTNSNIIQSVEAGEKFSFTVEIENGSPFVKNLHFKEQSPGDFQLINRTKTYPFQPGEKSSVVISIEIDPSIYFNNEILIIDILDDSSNLVGQLFKQIRIKSSKKLEITTANCPNYSLGLDTIKCQYYLINKAKSPIPISIYSKHGSIDMHELILNGGEQIAFENIQIASDPVNWKAILTNDIQVAVLDADTTISLQNMVEVFPRQILNQKSFSQMPIEVIKKYRKWLRVDKLNSPPNPILFAYEMTQEHYQWKNTDGNQNISLSTLGEEEFNSVSTQDILIDTTEKRLYNLDKKTVEPGKTDLDKELFKFSPIHKKQQPIIKEEQILFPQNIVFRSINTSPNDVTALSDHNRTPQSEHVIRGQGKLEAGYSKSLISVNPGEHFSLLFNIKNTSKVIQELVFKEIIPEDFKILIKRTKNSIKPGEKQKVIYTFATQKSSLARMDSLSIVIQNNNMESLFSLSKRVRINSYHHLNIETVDCPKYVLGLDTIHCQYLLENQGNAVENVKISTIQGKTSANEVVISPGDQKQVNVTQYASDPVNRKLIMINYMIANLAEIDSTFTITNTIQVYPRQVQRAETHHRLPIEVKNQYKHWIEAGKTYQFLGQSIAGDSQFGKFKEHDISFYVNIPAVNNRPSYQSDEDYFNIDYKFKNWNLNLGYQSLPLATSVEFINSGTGLSMAFQNNKNYFKIFKLGFEQNDRTLNWHGLLYRNSLSPHFSVSSMVFQKYLNDNQAWVGSFSTNYSQENINIEADISLEKQEQNLSVSNYLNAEYTGDIFRIFMIGRYQDQFEFDRSIKTKVLLINSNVQASKKISANFSFQYNLVQPTFSDLLFNIQRPFTRRLLGYIQWRFQRHSFIRLGARRVMKEDKNETKAFHFSEEDFDVSYHWVRPRWSFTMRTSIKSTKNLLIQTDEDNTSLQGISNNLNFQWTLNKNIRFQADAIYSITNRYSTENKTEKYLNYGTGFYLSKNKFSLNFSIRNSLFPDELYDQKSVFNTTFSWRGKQRNRISLQYKRANLPGSETKTDYITLNSSFRINAKLGRLKNKGTIRGKIYSKFGQANTRNFIIKLHDRVALSDPDGSFAFYDLEPGTYTLLVENASLAIKEIINADLPMILELGPGETKNVELSTVETSSFLGKVTFIQSKQTESRFFKKTIPLLTLKFIKNGNDFLTRTNPNGSFKIDRLTPGNYRIEVVENGWENEYEIVELPTELALETGEIKRLDFKIKAKERKVNLKKSNLKLKIKQ